MQTSGYREILKRHLAERMGENPRYSLRAFSRDLKISPSRLSEVLNGKQGLSDSWAQKIASSLLMSPEESAVFRAQVRSSDGRAKATRLAATAELATQARPADIGYQQLSFDTFQVISDWHHFALLELTKVKGFRSSPPWIAKRLGISEMEAKLASERLVRLGLLAEKNGKLRLTGRPLTTTNGVPSEAIRKFNRQLLDKAKEAVLNQSVEERDISSLTLAVKKSDLPRVIERIKKFRRELNQEMEFSTPSGADEVYSLAIQFFRLTAKEKA